MKHKICLHGLCLKNKGQLLTMVQKLLPPSTVKNKIKEKFLSDDNLLKYKRTKFVPVSSSAAVVSSSLPGLPSGSYSLSK